MDDTATLHRPRLLCLHGGGTNARIFRLQCRVLEKRLSPALRLVYAEGPITGVQPGPDVTSVYRDCGPFRSWLPLDRVRGARHWTSLDMAAAIDTALAQAMDEDDAKGATGAWIGILGFSQGAKVAASILYRQQRCGGLFRSRSNFRMAVLFAGRGPLVWLMPNLPRPPGFADVAAPSTPSTHHHPAAATNKPPQDADEHILRLPSIHVHGLRDPGLDSHRSLFRDCCHPLQATLVEWDGDHRMPIKSLDVEMVVRAIHKAAHDKAALAPALDVLGEKVTAPTTQDMQHPSQYFSSTSSTAGSF